MNQHNKKLIPDVIRRKKQPRKAGRIYLSRGCSFYHGEKANLGLVLSLRRGVEKLRRVFRKTFLRKAVATICILAILATAYFQNIQNAQSASYTWTQATWATTPPTDSGGCTAAGGTWTGSECVASHANNRSGWATYESKGANISAGTELTFSLISTSSTQTSDAQFGAGATSQTAVANDSVALDTASLNWADSVIVDSLGIVGSSSSVAIGNDGFARISYLDSTNSYLKYARCNDFACTTVATTIVDSETVMANTRTSIVIGVDGFARIAYVDSVGHKLRYARCKDDNCSSPAPTLTIIDSTGDVGDYPSIVLGSDGFARMSYVNDTADDLKFAKCEDDDCVTPAPTIQTIDSATLVGPSETAIGLDASDIPMFSYWQSGAYRKLRYAKCTDSSCSAANTYIINDSADYRGVNLSMKIGSDGYARISHINQTIPGVYYVACGDAACSDANSTETFVVSSGSSGATALVLDSNEYPRIASYYAAAPNALNYSYFNGSSWIAGAAIDSSASAGLGLSMAINSSDHAVVSYYDGDAATQDLKYAYQVSNYYSSGTFTSGVIDTTKNVSSWGDLSWTATLNGQTIQMKARSCDDAACSGEDATKPFGVDTDADWDDVGDTCNTITSGSALSTGSCVTDGEKYLQYKARLKTTDTAATPSLDSVTYGYNYYAASQYLYSSEYDTTDSTSVLSSLAWSEVRPANTDVQFQVRTSADGTTWSSWCGPDNGTTGCNTGSYFTDPTGGETVDADFRDGINDQWIQYRVLLSSSTGQYTPTADNVTLTYVVNATPVVSSVTAVQNTDGTISIGYALADSDSPSFTVSAYADIGYTLNETLTNSDTTITLLSTTLLPANGTIMLDSEIITYAGKSSNDLTGCTRGVNTTAATHSSGAVAWAKATTATGHIGSGQTTGTGKSITWTINTDYDGVYRNGSEGMIRVVANDGQLANMVGSANSANLVIDTKDPIGFVITNIDHTQNQVVITAATEDSNYEVYIANASGTLFDAGNITSPLLNQASTYPNTYTYASMTSDPATVYVGVKDAKGNTASTQMTTPAKPANPIYYDTSSSAQGVYQEFIAWDVVSLAQVGSGFSAYNIYRKIDSGNYSLLATITDRATNYYLDKINGGDTESDPSFDPNNPSTYTYRITTSDTAGNISAYSTEISDIPNGTGGSDTTAPTISNVTVTSINTTSATVTWDTDELANSYVGYSTQAECDSEPGGICPYLPERGFASKVLSHSITLTGLDSDTTYNIRVRSYDVAGNSGENEKDSPGNNLVTDFTFDTLAGPEISSVTVDSNNTNATVSWVTTTDSDTYVVYTDTLDNDGAMVNAEEVGVPDFVGGSPSFNHAQDLTTFNSLPLVSGDTYYFYVKSTDASDVTAIDNNGGSFYSFSTTQDDDAPVISGVSAVIRNSTSAAINWTTDEPANSTVAYGTTSGNLNLSGTVATYDNSHYVILAGLTANTTYYYTVTSADINTNEDTSIEYSFTTLRNPEEQHDPLSAITMLYNTGGAAGDPKVLTDTKAVIAFNTDQPALCTIEYGTISGSYAEVPVAETLYNENHSMHLTGLIFSTKYYYRITCEDNLETTVLSSEYSFTTSAQLQTSSEWGAGDGAGDTTAPSISSVKAGSITGESVTITWSTDEEANSLVKYGITKEFGSMAGNDLVNTDSANYDTDHSVVINNLIPSTKYYYTAISTDAAGNIAESAEYSFTAKAPSGMTAVNAESKSLGSAIITWTTGKDMTSIVEYGLTTSYSERKENSSKTKEHEIALSNLQAGQVYHYRVSGKDADGNLYSSNDNKFTPMSPPTVSNIQIEAVTENSAKITFTTNVPTDTLVTYTDVQNSSNSGSQGKPELSASHEIELKGLSPGTDYALLVKVKDEQGNENEDATKSFTTSKDENAPQIEKVKTDTALTQADKVQTIIYWTTNEPATATLIYQEGRNAEAKELDIETGFSTNHTAILTSFKSGAVYYFKVKSVDAAGNVAISGEYALLTPKRKENIIQVIINNFQDIFSWAKF